MFNSDNHQSRSLVTREAILSTALSLFRQRGLDNTTMRDIAQQAGVALGSAYYYYESKQAILQAYYDQVQQLHHARVVEALSNKDLSFEDRLKAAFHSKLDILHNDRKILGALFRYAGEPSHPLSPLGPATRQHREQSMATFRLALANENLQDDIRAVLPSLLWAAHMGILLYFIYDDSPGQTRVRKLVDGALSLLTSMLFLVRTPLFMPFCGRFASLLHDAGLAPDGSAESPIVNEELS